MSQTRLPCRGWAMSGPGEGFEPLNFTRRPLGKRDVLIKIMYSGICHSDIHTARGEWGRVHYPCLPGHEIAGQVVGVGEGVGKFVLGDYAGVGCLVGSCGSCPACVASSEQFCSQAVWTYNSKDLFHGGELTLGGYSTHIVVDEAFALRVPQNAPLERVAPLLCAGITTYSPLKFSRVGPGFKVGVAGFGGLGMMAVKYALALGAGVSVFARNDKKREAAQRLGAQLLIHGEKLGPGEGGFELIISTIPTNYDPGYYLDLLRPGGELAILGLPPRECCPTISLAELVAHGNKKIYGSLIGGLAQTQEMLDFSLKNEIWPEIELIRPEQIDEAYANLTEGRANFRYVIDLRNA